MYRRARPLLFAAWLTAAAAPAAAEPYWPAPGDAWQRRDPASVGMDPYALDRAVYFARRHEVDWSRDLAAQIRENVKGEPYPEVLGEARERGGPAGMVLREGYIVAEWGDTRRPDMSFSLAKSYLSALAGTAVHQGLIGGVHERVGETVHDGGFEGAHNGGITWHMLLNQTSEWTGTLWDKPDRADRRRGYGREPGEPGSFWEYNDVRVNRLALALLRVFRRPLPEVLREAIMDPIGAGDDWRWLGYRNSWVEIDGRRVQSVSGGSHWGGGLWMSARDHARFGLLWLRRGRWGERTLLSGAWIDAATTPTPAMPTYGYLWWLNPGGRLYPSAPGTSFFALGSGGNMIWVDPPLDLVVVTRWLEPAQIDEFIRLLRAAVRDPAPRP